MTGPRDAGFTLVEALIAFVIVAVALHAGFSILAGQSQRFRSSELELRAQDLARSLLAEASADSALQAGRLSGRSSDGLAYSLEITEAPGPAASSSSAEPAPRARLLQFDLVVTEPAARRPLLRVVTLRALPADPGAAQP